MVKDVECLSLDLFRHERWCFVSSFETTVCDTTFTPKNWSLLIGDDWWRFSKAFDSICLDQYDEDLDIKVVIVFGYPLSSFTIIIKISLRYLLTSIFSDMSENFRGYPRIIHLYFFRWHFPIVFPLQTNHGWFTKPSMAISRILERISEPGWRKKMVFVFGDDQQESIFYISIDIIHIYLYVYIYILYNHT